MEDMNFPFFGDGISIQSDDTTLPLYKEIAWDFEKNTPVIKNGKFQIVTENEAIKTWCFKSLMTNRFKEKIYSWNYGGEFEKLIGSQYTHNLVKAECTRYIEECLLINPYIKFISDVDVTFLDGTLEIYCKIGTIYGNSYMGVRV